MTTTIDYAADFLGFLTRAALARKVDAADDSRGDFLRAMGCYIDGRRSLPRLRNRADLRRWLSLEGHGPEALRHADAAEWLWREFVCLRLPKAQRTAARSLGDARAEEAEARARSAVVLAWASSGYGHPWGHSRTAEAVRGAIHAAMLEPTPSKVTCFLREMLGERIETVVGRQADGWRVVRADGRWHLDPA